jgi:hypothetical protein
VLAPVIYVLINGTFSSLAIRGASGNWPERR